MLAGDSVSAEAALVFRMVDYCSQVCVCVCVCVCKYTAHTIFKNKIISLTPTPFLFLFLIYDA
jgi:hypothetical protein